VILTFWSSYECFGVLNFNSLKQDSYGLVTTFSATMEVGFQGMVTGYLHTKRWSPHKRK